jgi:hypothetical protein
MGDGVRDVDGQLDGQVDGEGSGRREFLKKAGKIAFVVPAIQVLSMAPAGAQSNGSVVTTSMPPGSTMPPTSSTSSTSSSTTTTEAPCDGTRYRVKLTWDADQGLDWTTGVEDGDCITDSSLWDSEVSGSALGFTFNATLVGSSGVISAFIAAPEGCEIEIVGMTYLDRPCQVIAIGGPTTGFANANPPLVQFEAIVICCAAA